MHDLAFTLPDRRFIGGCDIVTQTFQSGELEKILQDAGVLE